MDRKLYVVSLFAVFLITGCASWGQMNQSTGTQVQLNSNNYKVIKAGAKGESRGFNFLCLIPFASPNFADAKANLYQNIGQKLEGKSVALANLTEDRSFMCLILFSIPKVTITADIVEFLDEGKNQNSQGDMQIKPVRAEEVAAPKPLKADEVISSQPLKAEDVASPVKEKK